MGSKKLSILICTMPEREGTLGELMDVLEPQLTPDVEVLIDPDEYPTIGDKRNALVARSSGEYVCFVDDDDMVSLDYVGRILKAVEGRPDCCSLIGGLMDGRSVRGYFEHSIRHAEWADGAGRFRWLRPPNHLNAIRRDLVIKCPFPSKSMGEDHDFSTAVSKLCKTESEIPVPIYQYIQRK
jgi:glycosyltransferase involved in cell wall biosynthesis